MPAVFAESNINMNKTPTKEELIKILQLMKLLRSYLNNATDLSVHFNKLLSDRNDESDFDMLVVAMMCAIRRNVVREMQSFNKSVTEIEEIMIKYNSAQIVECLEGLNEMKEKMDEIIDGIMV